MRVPEGVDGNSKGHVIFQFFAMLSGTLCIVSSGMHYGWTSPSLPKLQQANSTITVSNSDGSWMAVMPLVGATCGSLVGGVILDILGRKKVVLLTSLPFFASWIMVAYAKSVFTLITARFIAGIADGLSFCALPMYLGEIASPQIRGLLGSSCSFTWILGMLLINIIGSYTDIPTAALISSVFPVLLLVTFMWMPESPYYLIMKEEHEQAKRSLRIFRGNANVDVELERLTKAVKAQTTNTGKFLDLFTVKSNRKAVFIIMGLRAAQQFSGTMAITFYAQTIFKEAGDNISETMASIIYFSVQLLLSTISSMLVDRTGRKPFLYVSILGSSVALFLEGTFFYIHYRTNIDVHTYNYIPVVALIFFVVVFSIGMQAIPILLLGELFPTNVKAFALCLADIYFNVLATVVSKFFQIIRDSCGIYVPFFTFSACCIVGFFFIMFCVPETKGKTLEEIQVELKSGNKRKEAQSNAESFRPIAEA